MRRILLRRLLLAVPVLVAVSIASFLLVHMVPGDPVDFMLGDNAVPQAKAELRHRLHLDEPLPVQYVHFVADLAGGRLQSLHTKTPVFAELSRRFGWTILLASAALLLAVVIAIPAGTLAALRAGHLADHASMAAALAGVSMPTFWLGPLLVMLFAFKLNWLPVAGSRTPSSIVLPALTLGLGMAAILARMTRASVSETLAMEYVTAARARGLTERQVVIRHALRNALVPVVTMLGLQFGALLSGSIITEEIFAWPGIGRAVVEAVKSRDFPMFQGAVLFVAATYLVVNLLTDAAYAALDPRVRAS